VQVDPVKPTLKAPGIKRLILKHDKLHSSFAFKSNLRRYTEVEERLKELGRENAALRSNLAGTEEAGFTKP